MSLAKKSGWFAPFSALPHAPQAALAGLATLAALCAVLAMHGCNATTPAAKGPDAVYMAAEYPTLRLESLAYLGLASIEPDPIGPATVDGLLTSYLTGGQQKFIVIDASSCRMRARQAGLEPELNTIMKVWKDKHTVERFGLKKLGDKLGIDGIILADLTRWREEQVDWQGEGNSFTEVGVSLSIFDTNTGVLAWKGERMERQESAHYRHGEGVGTGVYKEQGSGTERSDRAEKIAPKPPDPKVVAESVVQSLMQGLPDKPAQGSTHTQGTPKTP